MFAHTKPPMDIRVTCQTEPFKLDVLKARFVSIVEGSEPRKRDEDLPRIPYIQKTSSENKVMTLAEFWRKFNMHSELYQLDGNASCELTETCTCKNQGREC